MYAVCCFLFCHTLHPGPSFPRCAAQDGYLTTYEALCCAVACLEGRPDLEDDLLQPLRLMTIYQARWDPAVAARNKWAVEQAAGTAAAANAPSAMSS